MKGVSEVIAIILILMITISLAGLAYMFMSTTMSDVTSSAGSTVDTTTSSMLTSFTIESMDVAKVYVRNTGQNALTSLSVYVNDEPAVYNVTTPIAVGTVGTITIYSFIPDGSTVKVTSPSGFSASKVANPCERAVGCWKFDEISGTLAYDNSPHGNTGTLINGPIWTSGKYGNAIQFDGIDDYVNINGVISVSTTYTISAFVKIPTNPGSAGRYLMDLGASVSGFPAFSPNFWTSNVPLIYLNGANYKYENTNIADNRWHFIVFVVKGGGLNDIDNAKTFIDGLDVSSSTPYKLESPATPSGKAHIGSGAFNGSIDEVRIYNRAIY
jgi:flagellin-like protein